MQILKNKHLHIYLNYKERGLKKKKKEALSSKMVVVHILHSPSPPFQACIHARPLQSCLTLCDPMECSPPGSSVHGILQARTLEWVACPPPGDLPDPVIKPASPAAPCVEGGFFTTEPPENPSSPRSSTDHLFFRIFVNGNVTVKE